MPDDDFTPHLGRMRAMGGKRARKYLARVLAASNLARGSGPGAAPGRRGFTGSRIGRGSGIGRVLARRGLESRLAQRRVVVKARIVRLSGKGAAAATAHLRYLQRDGVTREGEPGALYAAETDLADARAFHGRCGGDRHQFRFIVSAEDGAEYEDLKPLTRRLMLRLEEDLGTRLDWVAVDHFNTGHPHTHIVVRGIDDRGRDLVIGRDYLSAGIRERAAELVELDLGPRNARSIEAALRRDVEEERLTAIDHDLLRDAVDGVIAAEGADGLDQAIRAGRLAKLARLGLAERLGPARYRLDPELATTLRQMGERGDIIRTMQRAFTARAVARTPDEYAIYDPAAPGAGPLVGRVVARGLADEHHDHHFLIVDGLDGRSHFVGIGAGEATEFLAEDAVVRVVPLRAGAREADRTVAAVAAANGGHYDIDAHLRHDPTASQTFAETHVRRLEAMRKAGAGVERAASGRWTIAPDHLARAEAYERHRLAQRPVRIETLSPRGLEAMVAADAATWLDRELCAVTPEPFNDVGFGHSVNEAKARRRQWLVGQGLADRADGSVTFRTGLLEALRRRELLRVAGELAGETGKPFFEAANGARIEGTYTGSVDLFAGRFAVVERARDFTLVPWRPTLERQLGKPVAGIMRESGVSWSFGRGRGGPSIE